MIKCIVNNSLMTINSINNRVQSWGLDWCFTAQTCREPAWHGPCIGTAQKCESKVDHTTFICGYVPKTLPQRLPQLMTCLNTVGYDHDLTHAENYYSDAEISDLIGGLTIHNNPNGYSARVRRAFNI